MMARNPDLPCSGCGKLLWRGKGSLPGGEAQCRDCRATGSPKDHVLFPSAPVRHLSLVKDDGTIPTPPLAAPHPAAAAASPSVLVAAESGSESEQLAAISARIARTIADPSTNATALAALVRRQIDLFREIASLDRQPIDRSRLVSMRARVSRALDDSRTSATALSALTQRQIEISREITAVDAAAMAAAGGEGSVVAATDNELWDSSAI
jgi:hypothetical protein